MFDVACSDGLTPDSNTHRCADNGATVDLRTCAVSENKGAVELRALWSDPTFDPRQRAFYYVRVLENPSCRWSTWDAHARRRRAEPEAREDHPGARLELADLVRSAALRTRELCH